jgi:pyrophosphatase PpaX
MPTNCIWIRFKGKDLSAVLDTVLFDLDGTILDTNDLIIESILHVMRDDDAVFSREHIIPHMGKPLREQFQHFTGEQEVEAHISKYREFNLRMHDEFVQAFPYVLEVAEELKKHNVKLGVVTTKMRLTTDMGLQHCGLTPYFEAVVTLDDVSRAKPDPEPVEKAMAALGSKPGSTLMVGDSQFDIMAGKAAGVLTAGVAWSLKGEAFLAQYEPDYMLHDMRELLHIVGIERDKG